MTQDGGRDYMVVDACDQKIEDGISSGINAGYLKFYYAKLFPYCDMFKWLSYGNDGKHPECDQSYFGRREFTFTLESGICWRYLSFKNARELKTSIEKQCPTRVDIGPVYSVDPSKRKSYSGKVFFPMERELIFDIDITDYNNVRHCCAGVDVCHDCWPLMTVAIKIIDTSLREDFGFNHILWVYSGRRGVHCWVCDAKARRLTDEQRAAIADYFHVLKGNENNKKSVSLGGHSLHPFLVRSYTEFLKNFFEDTFLRTQKILSTEERYEELLKLISDERYSSDMRRRWQDQDTQSSISKEDVDVTRWRELNRALKRKVSVEIVFYYAHPRLDMQVTKHVNHLLKAPFSVHPNTGRVCVPIDPKRCEEFDPFSVPTVSQLVEEFNFASLGSDDELGSELDRTYLGKSIAFFRSSFLQPLLRSCKDEMENSYSKRIQQSKDPLLW